MTEITIKCSECGEEWPVEDAREDRIRFHTSDGRIAVFREGTTQKKVNETFLLCELCQEEKDEY